MILMDDVVDDPDMLAPQPFQILRSAGSWVLGGFQSNVTTLATIGPVQRASNKEVMMLPPGDRVSGIMAFWCTMPIYVTRGASPVPGSVGQAFLRVAGPTLTIVGGYSSGLLTRNGLFQTPGVDYTLVNGVVTLVLPAGPSDIFYFVADTIVYDGAEAADILVYPPNGEQYRVLAVKHYPGSGYWKALGTRMSAT